MKTLIVAMVIFSSFVGFMLIKACKDSAPEFRKAYFNVQLNTGEYWACYPRPEQNLVPLCIPRETAP